MQQSKIEGAEVKTNADLNGLIISTQQKNILSKQQQSFNKLVKRIEKLRLDLNRVGATLDESLDFYVKHIHPLEQQMNELNKEAAKELFLYFKNKKLLSKKERHSLGGIIARRLEIIFAFENGDPDDELKKIFEAVQGISYEEAVENDFENLKDEMKSMFDDFDIDMNFDDIHQNMTEEELRQKAAEMEEQLSQQSRENDQKQAGRKKTKKQKEKEEKAKLKEEARTKNISSIYKRLAKILHPDLEQNEEIKLQKEELMKQLTNAYESKDLHTLLKLELTWIQNEENNLDKLTDDKLEIYNEVLKEQIAELEDEMDDKIEHPRYQPLRKFTLYPAQMIHINMEYQKKQVENSKSGMAASVVKLKGIEKQAMLLVKKLIHDFDMGNRWERDMERFR